MKQSAEDVAEVKAAFQNIWNAVPMSARKRLAEEHKRLMELLVEMQHHVAKPHDDEMPSHGVTKKGK